MLTLFVYTAPLWGNRAAGTGPPLAGTRRENVTTPAETGLICTHNRRKLKIKTQTQTSCKTEHLQNGALVLKPLNPVTRRQTATKNICSYHTTKHQAAKNDRMWYVIPVLLVLSLLSCTDNNLTNVNDTK